ncbi:SIR2 family protein [Bacteroides ovatus]|uniref:SIR2 family protein n=1 Tax=Bacteroides ovatus TaxID=28116 RepID=UPI0012AC489D|nr:SIR2 family protein [Bacteroides ovatus]MDQ6234841.1 SIR2 family protein [Bacteroides ovatus]
MTMEEKDRLFKSIQDIVNDNPVLVIGCGASMNYGIPGMWDLAMAIKADFTKTPPISEESKKCVNELVGKLDAEMGLEDAMLSLKCTEEVENRILKIVWNQIKPKDNNVFMDVVQSRSRLPLANLLTHLIYNRADAGVDVVTTNYDCLIEYAASQTDAYVNCGCSQSHIGQFIGFDHKNQLAKLKDYEGCVNIYKIHGSLDWFVDNNGEMYNYPNLTYIPDEMKPCIITPGTNKYERALEDPHRSLISSVDGLFKEAFGYMCIGYGFNDKHIQPNLLKMAIDRKKRILIVTKDLTKKIENEVIAKAKNYIIVYSDGANGTRFKSSSERIEIVDDTTEYWRLENFMSII